MALQVGQNGVLALRLVETEPDQGLSRASMNQCMEDGCMKRETRLRPVIVKTWLALLVRCIFKMKWPATDLKLYN